MAAYRRPAADVVAALGADVRRGLRAGEAAARLERDGRNELTPEKPPPAWRQFLAQFHDGLVVLLLVAASISAALWLYEGDSPLPYEAMTIFAVVLLNAGPGEIGWLSSAQTLPFLLLSIPMGVLADRWSRSRLMVLAEGLRALSLLALWALVGGGALSLAMLALLGFIGAAGTVGFTIAAPALVPSLVPAHELARANTRLELARSAAFAAGPALAGSLVAESGRHRQVARLVAPLRDLFAAVFFVAVGTLVDPMGVVENWGAVLVFVGVVVLGKIVSVALGSPMVSDHTP